MAGTWRINPFQMHSELQIALAACLTNLRQISLKGKLYIILLMQPARLVQFNVIT